MTSAYEPFEEKTPRFSRRWWLESAHTLFWVVLATVLIWIYADMEFTDEAKLKVTLQLNAGESKTVGLLPPTEQELAFTVSGSHTSLERFRSDLAARGAVLTLDVSQEYAPGQAPIPAGELLEKAAQLRRRGLKIENIKPEAIPVHLDTLQIIQDVPVELDAVGAAFKLTHEPPKVEIRIPESRWKRIQKLLHDRSPKLKTLPVDLKEYPEGREVPITAEINPILEGEKIDVVDKTVGFLVDIISPLVTAEAQVSIQVLAPASWAEADGNTWDGYMFVPNPASDWRPKLKIEGEPKDVKPENVWAYIRLTDDDKKSTDAWLTRDVIVSFSPQVKLRLLGPTPKVQFRLEKRKASAVTPPIP
jgi:hypothetical protein